ncbi:MAG: TonB-dependent receptor [Methylobacter sp.]|nr:MAG: TonB-dependent receptor [Methylobacter sp.]
MNARVICYVFGITFILVGLLGFIENPLVSETGFFAVNWLHNLVHIIAGAAFILGTRTCPGYESNVLKAMGSGGIVVTLVNFLTEGEKMLFLIQVNQADRWLHLGLAIIVLVSGFIFRDAQTRQWKALNT